MLYEPDTIVAPITPTGEGAVGIIRLSGPSSPALLKKIFKSAQLREFVSHHLYHGSLLHPETSEVLDDVLVTWMKNPRSFTGEDVVEIHTHGSPRNINRILRVLLSLGARMAEPGEFSKRAYLNGKLDLTQAEAIAGLITAKTDDQLNHALGQLGGRLSQIIHDLRSQLLEILALIEAGLDFSEEDLPLNPSNHLPILNNVKSSMGRLIDSFQTGQILQNGLRVALLGRPNVGKSTLLNLLLEEDRAIIHDLAGTTRDVLSGEREYEGLALTLYDTAGVRVTDHPVELEGIQRSLQTAKMADVVLLLLDLTQPLTDEDWNLLSNIKDKPHLILLNKKDQPQIWSDTDLQSLILQGGMRISAKDSQSKEIILSKIKLLFINKDIQNEHNYVLNNVRHWHHLQKAFSALNDTIEGIQKGQILDEIIVEQLKVVASELAGITGGIDSDEVLGQIFSRFCIGK